MQALEKHYYSKLHPLLAVYNSSALSTQTIGMPANAVDNERLNTLVDGIFAIVLTLLVLDIKIPETTSDAELIDQLIDLWPQFFSFGLSFVILGIFWLGHQLESRYIRSSDHFHLLLTLMFMMFISLLPFSASLLGAHTGSRVAVIVYGSNILLASLLRYVHWRYVTGRRRLVDDNLSERLISSMSKTFLSTPLLCLAAIALSLLSVKASLFLLLVTITNILFRISHIFRHHANKPE